MEPTNLSEWIGKLVSMNLKWPPHKFTLVRIVDTETAPAIGRTGTQDWFWAKHG